MIPDNTVYSIQTQLSSHPATLLKLSKSTPPKRRLKTLEEIEADPKFQSLSPEVQEIVLSRNLIERMRQRILLPPVIRAVGQPGSDAIEILVIGQDFIQSCKSTSDYFVISRFKRIK